MKVFHPLTWLVSQQQLLSNQCGGYTPIHLEWASGSFLNKTKQLILVFKNFYVSVALFMFKTNRARLKLRN